MAPSTAVASCNLIGILLLARTCIGAIASKDRSAAFINYHERSDQCEDQLPECSKRAWQNGCIYDPYAMRRFCPVSCNIDRCTGQGSIKTRHKGHASAVGTNTYMDNMNKHRGVPPAFYVDTKVVSSGAPLHLSSMGTGTYLGDLDAKTDEAVTTAIIYGVTHGWNVIDTASNYRFGRAELSVGRALDSLLAGSSTSEFSSDTLMAQQPDIMRDMLFISTKAGFTTPSLVSKLIKDGLISRNDVVQDMHCMHPEYLRLSLQQSLERMKLEQVDLLYLHNAAEVQLPAVGRQVFMERLRDAFTYLETARAQGVLQYYGLATWDCFRRPPGDKMYLGLEDVVRLARQAGGDNHGMRFMQLPVNVAMPEAWLQPWQPVKGTNMSLLAAASALHVGMFASGPLLEAQLLKRMTGKLDGIKELMDVRTTPAKLLQYARSTPGLVSTLVGHKAREHVEYNVALAQAQPMAESSFLEAYQGIKGALARAGVQ